MKRYMIIILTMILLFLVLQWLEKLVIVNQKLKNQVYTRAKKSNIKLTAADLAIIDKAIQGNFSNLTNDEKDKLAQFLSDFGANTAHEKGSRSSNK